VPTEQKSTQSTEPKVVNQQTQENFQPLDTPKTTDTSDELLNLLVPSLILIPQTLSFIASQLSKVDVFSLRPLSPQFVPEFRHYELN